MARSSLLLLALAGLSSAQFSPFSTGGRPGRVPLRQGAAPNPLWSASLSPRRPFEPYPAPQDISFLPRPPAPAPAVPIRQPCTAVSARVDLVSGVSNQVSGAVFFYQECPDHPVMITGRISGLSPGKHGLHVHEHPNLTDQCKGAGGHFNPFQSPHGAQTNGIDSRHVGDLGNIEANFDGIAELNIVDDIISLFPGEADIFRRSVVVHSDRDDLGKGGNEGSLKTGNAGMRLACGIIAPNNSPRCS
ncbi:superoxide dismutase [Cu-Zn]-like isoform X2 [Amphibalanus amphitrite]|uniref:superoxide dismutase [Cu-Zn]-like isoform X2 n=1 Tax=Amphibalanus amphitrite TaxID=1232801 RepID=UPI001C9139F6|nr:superoxide dismutase [Cu-Zn]-like isoform X2 [Amphibalanus amphitrite]